MLRSVPAMVMAAWPIVERRGTLQDVNSGVSVDSDLPDRGCAVKPPRQAMGAQTLLDRGARMGEDAERAAPQTIDGVDQPHGRRRPPGVARVDEAVKAARPRRR